MLDRHITFGGDVINAWITAAPTKIVPERKMTVTSIPGTSRVDIKMEDAWEPYEQPYTLFVGDGTADSVQAQIDGIVSKLYKNGLQRLLDDYDDDYFRLAYFKGPFDVENRFTRAGKAEVIFVCMPERYLKTGDNPVSINSGDTLSNPTPYNARPLIKVEGSGTGTLIVNGKSVTVKDLIDYYYIDCYKQDVYRLPTENRNNKIEGAFPILPPGNSTITYSGGITAVTITPRWYII